MPTTAIRGAQHVHHCDQGGPACPPLRSGGPSTSTTTIREAQHVHHCDQEGPACPPLWSWEHNTFTTVIMEAQHVHHYDQGATAWPPLRSWEPSMATTTIRGAQYAHHCDLVTSSISFLSHQVLPGPQQICHRYVSIGTRQKMWTFSKQRPWPSKFKTM